MYFNFFLNTMRCHQMQVSTLIENEILVKAFIAHFTLQQMSKC